MQLEDHVGIIPRVSEAIMEKAESLSEEYEISCSVSYFELYKEDIRDLLSKSIILLKCYKRAF